MQFLDVQALLEKSQPRGSGVRFWQIAGVFLFVVLLSTYIGSRGPAAAKVLNVVSGLVMVGLVGVMAWISWNTFRRAAG